MTHAQETRKMIREFAVKVNEVRELALCLDAHLGNTDIYELGLDDHGYDVVSRAFQHMMEETEHEKQIDLRSWLEETES